MSRRELVQLRAAKEAKRQELKEQRESIIAAPINNVQVGTLEDRENIKGTIDNFSVLAPSGSINWVMVDNTIQSLSQSDLQAVIDTYIGRKAQTFNDYGVKLTELQNAATIEEVKVITW